MPPCRWTLCSHQIRPGGRDFELLCKWLLENVPEYRQRVTRIWLWDDWLGRWEQTLA